MKRLTTIPKPVLETIKSEHERALEIVYRQYQFYCALPVRPVRMRILREGESNLEQTIIPSTTVHLKPNAFLDDDHIDRDALTYLVAGTKRPFPYGHIYEGSGHVCLGSIFVPSKISKYNPTQPLETLFLHNDRNLNHGNASLFLSKEKVAVIRNVLEKHSIQLSMDAENSLKPKHNMLKDDGIWLIGADVYKQADLLTALKIMTSVYNCIFQGEGV